MRHLALRGAAAAAVITAAAACSAGSSEHIGTSSEPPSAPVAATAGPGGVQQVTIDATDMFRFSPATVTAHPGKLQVTLVDKGSYPHNLSVSGLHVTSKTVSGDLGQDTTTFTLSVTKPGTYAFECTFHSSAGMRGEFVIK